VKPTHALRNGFKSNRRRLAGLARWMVNLATLTFVIFGAACAPVTAPDATPISAILETTPTPQVILNTPAAGEQLYNLNGLSLYLKTSLPESPAEASVYLAPPDQPATIESAQALAEQFGIQGEVYLAPDQMRGAPNSYMVTAGGARLYISSDHYFSYYTDYGKENDSRRNISDEQARTAIEDFMASHGFDFEYQIERTSHGKGSFRVIPLLDERQLRYNPQRPAGLEIELDDEGRSSAFSEPYIPATCLGSILFVQRGKPFNS